MDLVEVQSSALKKELRLGDLVGIQILNIVGFSWIGTAGKLGSSHLMFWLPAVLLFYIPSGIVVAHLAREMPLEGGMYQWARLRFGPLAGFLVAANLWVYNVMLVSLAGLSVVAMAPYVLGPGAAWMASSKLVILTMSLGIICGLMLVAWRGLALGKWINNLGGFSIVVIFGAAILLALPRWFSGAVATAPVAITFPALSLMNLNLLGKMSFGGLGGFDAVAVFAGECRSKDAAQMIGRSVWLAAPLIAAMQILGTASVLVFSRPESIDLIAPPIQILSIAAPALAKVAAALFVFSSLAAGCLYFNLMARLPMVAGWDHLLPEWFGRLDQRFMTPVGSVLVSGFVSVIFALVANAGAGNQEAFQFLLNAATIAYACGYLAMFAIPLAARGERPSWRVRAAALSGFLMTLLYVVLSAFPIVDVQNPGLFTVKIVSVVGGLQCAGVLYYRRAMRINARMR